MFADSRIDIRRDDSGTRRNFLGKVVGGIVTSVVGSNAWAKERKVQESAHKDANAVRTFEEIPATFQWRMLVSGRVTIAAGPPRHRAFTAVEKLTNGDLLVAYREGTDHWRTKDGIVRIVRSSDGGRTWAKSVTVWEIPGHNLGTHVGLAQLSDGTLLLPVQDAIDLSSQPWSMKAYMMRSADNGYTWSKPEEPRTEALLKFDWFNTYGKILELGDGTVLWSIGCQKKGYEMPNLTTGLLCSRDGGRTWPEFREVATGTDEEKSVMILSSGRMVAIIRDYTNPNYFLRTYSNDQGLTWSPLRHINIKGQAPCLHRSSGGALLLSYRAVETKSRQDGGRESVGIGVGIATSFDEGNTWHLGRQIYAPQQVQWDLGYPSMIQIDDKEIFCVYYTAFDPVSTRNNQIEGVYLTESI